MKTVRNVAFVAAGVALLIACKTESREEVLSPPMQKALRVLADLPLSTPNNGRDAGAPGSDFDFDDDNVEPGGRFGDSSPGSEIVTGIGDRGPTGTGPGNGGVGFGTGPGNGGVGNSTAPGSGGVGRATGAGGGGVAAGSSVGGGVGELASVVCEFLGAICSAISVCESGTVDASCDFPQPDCVGWVQEIVAHSREPLAIPPGAIAGLRCMSNALRMSGCIFSEKGMQSLEPKLRACGLPVDNTSSPEAPDFP